MSSNYLLSSYTIAAVLTLILLLPLAGKALKKITVALNTTTFKIKFSHLHAYGIVSKNIFVIEYKYGGPFASWCLLRFYNKDRNCYEAFRGSWKEVTSLADKFSSYEDLSKWLYVNSFMATNNKQKVGCTDV
jgi:hypothetical protein